MAPLDEAALCNLRPALRVCQVAAGSYLLRAGQRPLHLYFVVRGLLRQVYQGADGREINERFYFDSDLAGSYAALLLRGDSASAIQALESSTLICIDFDSLEKLAAEREPWQRLLRSIAESTALEALRRAQELLSMTPTERYRALLAAHPNIQARIPQYHLASYLGITAVGLCRIRRRIGAS